VGWQFWLQTYEVFLKCSKERHNQVFKGALSPHTWFFLLKKLSVLMSIPHEVPPKIMCVGTYATPTIAHEHFIFFFSCEKNVLAHDCLLWNLISSLQHNYKNKKYDFIT
jgi:hypothetical protein